MDEITVEKVLRTVECIPPGEVAAYGQVGAVSGVGPRLVGRILREWGSTVPWWRVTASDGKHPLLERALPHWREEGITVSANGAGCRMQEFGTDLQALAERSRAAFRDLCADTPGEGGARRGPSAASSPPQGAGTSSRK